jgi:hypothetical protein
MMVLRRMTNLSVHENSLHLVMWRRRRRITLTPGLGAPSS